MRRSIQSLGLLFKITLEEGRTLAARNVLSKVPASFAGGDDYGISKKVFQLSKIFTDLNMKEPVLVGHLSLGNSYEVSHSYAS